MHRNRLNIISTHDQLFAGFGAQASANSVVRSSTAQHSTAQHSTAQHSTAQHSTAQHTTPLSSTLIRTTMAGNSFLFWVLPLPTPILLLLPCLTFFYLRLRFVSGPAVWFSVGLPLSFPAWLVVCCAAPQHHGLVFKVGKTKLV